MVPDIQAKKWQVFKRPRMKKGLAANLGKFATTDDGNGLEKATCFVG